MYEEVVRPIIGTALLILIVGVPLTLYYGIFNFEEKEAAKEYTLAAFFLIGVAGMILSYIQTGNPFAH